ncbi:hypothetical protein Dsin_005718 [Dipteronia sinensis]|uniref:Uncharacterized protein n=1 Tax=Dipteronia sinensis TaxID=43782 RepID=A0AAE0AX47_9ROSI|nr:hypothetical protein Dsin_005718 [Dipteronia sinensis]
MFRIPVRVTKKIEKLQRDFFWNDGITKKKVHAVDWISVCKSKKDGDLGIGRIKDKGESLLAKWIWRFGREHSSLWKNIICAKYSLNHNSLNWEFLDVKGCSHFVKAVNSLYKEGTRSYNIITKGFQVVVGNGDRVRLWKDLRWDSFQLRMAFPRIFALASNKVEMLNEYGSWVDSSWVLNVGLRRQLFGWETDQWNCFLLSLQGVSVRRDIPDALAWSYCSNGTFFVSSLRGAWKIRLPNSQGLDGKLEWIVWWFKNFGCGSKEDITLLLLDVKERCIDSKLNKVNTNSVWSPPLNDDLTFNVDGSVFGNPGMAGRSLSFSLLLFAFPGPAVFSRHG